MNNDRPAGKRLEVIWTSIALDENWDGPGAYFAPEIQVDHMVNGAVSHDMQNDLTQQIPFISGSQINFVWNGTIVEPSVGVQFVGRVYGIGDKSFTSVLIDMTSHKDRDTLQLPFTIPADGGFPGVQGEVRASYQIT